MFDLPPVIEDIPESADDSPLPLDIERVSAYAWQRGAAETILFHGAAQLITAAGPLDLERGTWLLARWTGPPLEDIPDGELVCILPEGYESR
jgi:hypothetical protein